MPVGKLVFAQLMDFLPLHTFRRCVARYPSSYPTKTFSHLDQYLCMAFVYCGPVLRYPAESLKMNRLLSSD
jgi:Domain of unknown function (DUF4372)